MAGLFVSLADGPLKGANFTVARCPREVRCVRASDGTMDILNEPDDAPRLDEEVHWYRWDGGRVSGHICGRGRGHSGCYTWVELIHAPEVRALRAPDPVNPGARTV